MKQSKALEVLHSGVNVFLTGAPGAGKTFVLNQFIQEAEAEGKQIAITASTGIAASHINGLTIHSWSGTGIAESLDKADMQRLAKNSRLRKRFTRTNILIVDEVSMLHGYRLDMINEFVKYICKSDRPFGGMQVILVGDLFQLPPVSRDNADLHFVHMSKTWRELDLRICYLTEQHRQEGEDLLLGVLEAMRMNKVEKKHKELLAHRLHKLPADDETVTKLYSHNADVDYINQEHLNALPGDTKRYKMTSEGNPYITATMMKNILAPETLELKVGAEVMFVANNFTEHFFNGTRGTVIKFNKSGEPVVKLKNGRKIHVERHSWKMKEGDHVIAEVKQTPLRLAWAITIHKSQGMSLDSAEIDLGDAFTPAMGYVALSRVRSIHGLYLKGINDMALTMHSEIYDFDLALREASEK